MRSKTIAMNKEGNIVPLIQVKIKIETRMEMTEDETEVIKLLCKINGIDPYKAKALIGEIRFYYEKH